MAYIEALAAMLLKTKQTFNMEWLNENKEWFLSGLGVSLLGIIVTLLQRQKRKNQIKMRQKSGSNSTNIQIGGDFNARK